MHRTLFGFLDVAYLLKFILIFLGLYYLNIYMIGVTTPGGTYYPFVADYLNYPVWVRTAVLFISQQITHIFGYHSNLVNDTLVNDDRTKILQMGWPCYGLAIMSFWFAFVISHAEPLKQRMKWIAIGISTIFLINVTRITLLYIASADEWSIGATFNSNNHDLFNYISYIAIAILLVIYKSTRTVNHSDIAATSTAIA